MAFANDPAIMEEIEALRTGEPIACSGPFSVVFCDREPAFRITVESMIDTKRRRKSKGLISKEQRVESEELELAPVATAEEGLNDDVPF
jgi:hypothetical protein